MTGRPLTPAERLELDKVVGPDARGTYRLAEQVWLAARAYDPGERPQLTTEDLHEATDQVRAHTGEQDMQLADGALDGFLAAATFRDEATGEALQVDPGPLALGICVGLLAERAR